MLTCFTFKLNCMDRSIDVVVNEPPQMHAGVLISDNDYHTWQGDYIGVTVWQGRQ